MGCQKTAREPSKAPQTSRMNPVSIDGPQEQCDSCGAPINQKVADYSRKRFGRNLCMDCQKQAQSGTPSNGQKETFGICVTCGKKINGKTAEFSMKKFGCHICYDCQQKINAGELQNPAQRFVTQQSGNPTPRNAVQTGNAGTGRNDDADISEYFEEGYYYESDPCYA